MISLSFRTYTYFLSLLTIWCALLKQEIRIKTKDIDGKDRVPPGGVLMMLLAHTPWRSVLRVIH